MRLQVIALLACAWLAPAMSVYAVKPAAADAPVARWQALDTFVDEAVGPGGYTGAVASVWQDGQAPHVHAAGMRDLAGTAPMREDAIFRIYSMTKPVVSVAVLMLVDSGDIGLDDDIARHLPAFSQLRVLDENGAQRAPARALTIRHLLTHTSGIANSEGGALRLREAAGLDDAPDLDAYVQRLAAVPLQHDPGTVFAYDGAATNVLSRLVEVVSGEPLDAFLRTRLFVPLGMVDTGFSVPAEQRVRVVDITTTGDDGKLRIAEGPSATTPGAALNPYTSGAGGLYSTAADYLRFARMLLGGGALDGTRYLREDTVAMMVCNQLGFLDAPHTSFSPYEGFGFGVSVQLDPAARGRLGAPGQAGWSGAASTYFTIDPTRGIVAILLAQHLPRDVAGDPPRLATPFYNLVQQGAAP
ncbi:beta-lactamase family protein [Luteimonas fraxinea]|uniref:serine hydrolase domain-containing protein n=1 Tax=Luteimonas fraxinea TaxID=2901869 RepID=UPI001E59EFF6|nr:serine hydrolase domain-containing protein [Luteimonas fraxinea]MCD9125121.1 beta-lactamase family protein [Luteimonas fraxinea]UHH11576.1 beta-lactamase family protein [Luteimonas fraxinea]